MSQFSLRPFGRLGLPSLKVEPMTIICSWDAAWEEERLEEIEAETISSLFCAFSSTVL